MTYRSIRSAAGELGVSQRFVRRAIRNGGLPAIQIAGTWRIPASYFEELEARAYGRLCADPGQGRMLEVARARWPRKWRWWEEEDDDEGTESWPDPDTNCHLPEQPA